MKWQIATVFLILLCSTSCKKEVKKMVLIPLIQKSNENKKTAFVNGVIVDEYGKTVPSVKVSIKDIDSVNTDENGYFKLEVAEMVNVKSALDFDKTGFTSNMVSVIPGEHTCFVHIRMKKLTTKD